MSNEKTPGQIAFEAYNVSKGGLTWDGMPIPGWDALTNEAGVAVRAGWEAAALSVLEVAKRLREAEPARNLIGRARDVIANGASSYVPPRGREASLVLTKLDEALMWYGAIPASAP